MTFDNTNLQSLENEGQLSYQMETILGDHGSNTEVEVTPNHDFSQIAPKLVL